MATENLHPQVISRLMGEIRDLVRNPVEGISYLENDENSVSEIHAQITGPEGTPFVGGKFKMKLVISEEYPNTPPRGFFLTKIYHPNVANNGDICVNTLKKDWTADTTIKHVLQVIRCLLIVPFPESSLNDEAGKLFMDSYEEYARRARIVTEVHAMAGEDEEEQASTSCRKAAAGESSAGEEDCQAIASISEQKKKAVKDAKKKSLKRL